MFDDSPPPFLITLLAPIVVGAVLAAGGYYAFLYLVPLVNWTSVGNVLWWGGAAMAVGAVLWCLGAIAIALLAGAIQKLGGPIEETIWWLQDMAKEFQQWRDERGLISKDRKARLAMQSLEKR